MSFFCTAEVLELRPGRRLNVWQHKAHSDAKANLLFCHGSMASMVQYRQNIEYAISRGDLNILAYDWLGCGGSEKPEDWDAYSTPELLLDLEAAYCRLIKDAPNSTPTVVVGHSYGTSLVTQFDAEARSAVAADIFESTPGSNDSSLLPPPAALCLLSTSDGTCFGNDMAVFMLPEFVLCALQPKMTAAFAKAALHPATSEEIRREAIAVSEKNEMRVCKAFYRQCSWRDPEAAQCAGPALCVHGDADGLIPLENARAAAAQHAQAAFHVVGPASHQVMSEQPEATNALLGTLLDNVISGQDALQGLDRLK